MISWLGITSLGSFTVMTPAAAAISVWLALNRAWSMVLWWCLLFIGGSLLVVATKIAFIGWGLGLHALDFTGFSGHVMRAAAVAPVLLYLLLQKTSSLFRKSGVALGLAFGVLIGFSRLEVNAHSVSESVSGWVLGAVVSLGFIWVLSNSPRINLNRWVVVFSISGLLATPNIAHVPTQRWITQAALYLSGHDRPYIRASWKMAPVKWRLSPLNRRVHWRSLPPKNAY
ncbi:MAG: phosphatase PAP2 family protein [Sulfuriferula sp.]